MREQFGEVALRGGRGEACPCVGRGLGKRFLKIVRAMAQTAEVVSGLILNERQNVVGEELLRCIGHENLVNIALRSGKAFPSGEVARTTDIPVRTNKVFPSLP